MIKKLQEGNFEIFVGDANVATIKQVETAALNWGVIDVCKKYYSNELADGTLSLTHDKPGQLTISYVNKKS